MDKSCVARTEIDDAEERQAIMETATSQDIKYAPGTSALRSAGDAGEVTDITETTDENENAPGEYPGTTGLWGIIMTRNTMTYGETVRMINCTKRPQGLPSPSSPQD